MFARQTFRYAQPLRQVSYNSACWELTPQYLPQESKLTPIVPQSFRKYSSEAPPKKSLAPFYITAGLAGLGIGLYRYSSTANAEPKERPKVFVGGDQGWVDLKLANIETITPNTKRFRFEFEDPEAISGVHVACKSIVDKFFRLAH